jgi:hypothetical protein
MILEEATMSDAGSVGIIGGVAVLVILGVLVWLFRGRKSNPSATPEGEKPAWMRNTPPKETIAALKEDGEKMAVFDYDKGEKLAAPFAEQIEDMVRAKLNADPFLKSTQIDFGTAPDGGIEFHLNGQVFAGLEQMPDGRIKAIIKQAIKTFNQRK